MLEDVSDLRRRINHINRSISASAKKVTNGGNYGPSRKRRQKSSRSYKNKGPARPTEAQQNISQGAN